MLPAPILPACRIRLAPSAEPLGKLRKMQNRRPPPTRSTAARGRLASPSARDRVLAWLDARINYERTPALAGSGQNFELARMRRLVDELGNPHLKFPVVHVAGTKGKGSTVAMLSAILEESGHRVGRYMSPHVHAIEERICIDGEPISASDMVAVFDVVMPKVEALDQAATAGGRRRLTWFEIMTSAAFVHFARQKVGIAVVETGLGGRLDATNVSQPLVTVITSISLDHMKLLGPTIARIAGEKAGIIKRGCPIVSGATQPSARRVIATVAARRRAPLLQIGRDFSATPHPPTSPAESLRGSSFDLLPPGRHPATRRYRIPMAGRHQIDNAALAVVAAMQLEARGVRVGEAAIARGLDRAWLPARIETRGERPLVIVDAAHNVASMRSLLEAIGPVLAMHAPQALVFAASADKQIEKMLALAAGHFSHVVITRYRHNPRAASVERLTAACMKARARRGAGDGPVMRRDAGRDRRRGKFFSGRRDRSRTPHGAETALKNHECRGQERDRRRTATLGPPGDFPSLHRRRHPAPVARRPVGCSSPRWV
jgi:dihydrofolate synthase/folylpolyglutamate synthase